MLGSGSKRKRKASNIDTLIGEKAEISGDVRFSGGLHVDGVIKGNVTTDAADDSSLLSVGIKGSIEGDVEASNVVLNGNISGILRSNGYAELAPGARVTGDIYYNLLQVTPRAEINGRLIYTPSKDRKKAMLVGKAAPRRDDAALGRDDVALGRDDAAPGEGDAAPGEGGAPSRDPAEK